MAQLVSNIKPKLILDWKQIPDWVNCVRAGSAWYFFDGVLVSASANQLRVQNDGLLIEDTRKNHLLYSRGLNNAAWTGYTNVSLSGVGLDGVDNTASYIDVASQTDIYQGLTLASGDYVCSVYLKREPTNTGDIFISADGTNFTFCDVSEEWQRFFVTVSATTSPKLYIRTSGKLYADCAQIEEGTTPSSPIITTSVGVTRDADLVTFGIDLWNYSPTKGSWVIKATLNEITTNNQTLLFASESTPTSDYFIARVLIDTDRVIYQIGYGSEADYQIVDADIDPILGYSLNTRICSTYDINSYAYINGSIPALPTTPPTAGIDYNTLDTVWIGCNDGNDFMNGVIHEISFYDFPINAEDGVLITQY